MYWRLTCRDCLQEQRRREWARLDSNVPANLRFFCAGDSTGGSSTGHFFVLGEAGPERGQRAVADPPGNDGSQQCPRISDRTADGGCWMRPAYSRRGRGGAVRAGARKASNVERGQRRRSRRTERLKQAGGGGTAR